MKIKSAVTAKVISDEMADRSRRNKRLLQARLDEVYKKCPRIHECDVQLSLLAFDMGRQLMNGENSEGIKAAADKLIKARSDEKKRLLAENGFPIDYLDDIHTCQICKDTGKIGQELCSCVVQQVVNAAFKDSGVNQNENFRNFDLSLQHEQKARNAMARILDIAVKYANDFPKNELRDLLLFGESGVGKTYLLNCIGGKVLERGYSVLKINAHRLITLTLDTMRLDPSEKPDFVLPDLLIIDDLGTEPIIPNITIETLLSIICQRQDASKATAFATNLSIVSAEGEATLQSVYGERLSSRLVSPKTVRIQGIHTANVRLKG